MSEPADPTPRVTLHLGDLAVARIASLRAGRVPGVVALQADLAQSLLGIANAVLGQGHGLPTAGVSATVREHDVDVSVTVVTRLGYNCRELAGAVQRAVAADVAAHTGLRARVAVTVAEVLLD